VEELMTSHYARNLKWTNEVWGLTKLHKTDLKTSNFLTVSDDGTLREFSAELRQQLRLINLNIDAKNQPL